MASRAWLLVGGLLLVGQMAYGCATSETEADDDDGVGGATSSVTSGGGMGGSVSVSVGVGGSGGSALVTEVFGHSGSTLYRLDPETNVVTEVGDFSSCGAQGGILDIALDKDSNLWGTKRRELYRIDRTTGACTLVNALPMNEQYPDSLSFVPEGTVDANVEALVGYVGADYVRIDTQSGAITTITADALTDGLISSGDIVSVIDGATYLTVKDGACEPNDCIVEVDPTTGAIVTNYGDVGYDQVFGLAFWGGKAYGFAREGVLFSVTFGTNNVASTEVPFPSAPPSLEFFGAGSATSVPFEPPK
jgi:hypothetical protein